MTADFSALIPAFFPSVLAPVAAAWLGACFGSFSNVLIYRLPRNITVVHGRSQCPSCQKMVVWYDNIPLLSWMVLRGKCRQCQEPISIRYLLVEMAGAASVLIGLWRFGWTPEGFGAAAFLLMLLDIALIDWQHMIIPHTLTVSGMLIGLIISGFGDLGLAAAIMGLIAGAGVILAVSYGYKLIRGVVGMGGGDVMLMGMVGSFLGPWGVPGVLFGGALFGSIYAVISGAGKLNGGAKLPFGTFLAAASAVVLLWGEPLAKWYLGIFYGGS